MKLGALIAADRAQWESPIVEASMFDVVEPEALARLFESFCETLLGSRVAEARFYRVSVGCVAGFDLEDGRSVVLKAQRNVRRAEYLRACCELRGHLRERGFPCPGHVLGPTPLQRAWVTVESLEEPGVWRDAHDPAIRKEVARSLAELAKVSATFDDRGIFRGSWFTGVPADRVFPVPHSPLFDFEATERGAEWIVEIARAARARRSVAEGAAVIGHFDWRVEHLRFDGDRLVMSYDWDSVHRELDTVLVGVIARNFTADWQREDVVRSPTLEEMRAFVNEYEEARGVAFSAAERRTIAASCVYTMAYNARCNHAIATAEGANGDARPMLREVGVALLDEGL